MHKEAAHAVSDAHRPSGDVNMIGSLNCCNPTCRGIFTQFSTAMQQNSSANVRKIPGHQRQWIYIQLVDAAFQVSDTGLWRFASTVAEPKSTLPARLNVR
jgi:hypothetical protein